MSTPVKDAKNRQPQVNFLKPDLKAGFEERRRAASLTRLMFIGAALVVWILVGLKVWDISLVISERRPDELEKVRISQEVADLNAVLSKVPSGMLNAREGLYAQVRWSGRLAIIRDLASPDLAFATYGADKDGTFRLGGFVANPSAYADILDRAVKLDFVTELKAAALYAEEQAGYIFQIEFGTLPTEEK